MATIHMRYPNGLKKAVTFSYDDGVEQDIRLVEIFNKYALKGTFNINTGAFAPEGTVYPKGQIHRRMTEKQTVALFKNSPHEVAVHTLTHPYLERMAPAAATYEVLGDKMNIEKLFGKITRGMAYPFGTYSDEVVDILKNCGIAYARDVICSSDFSIPTDWLRLKPTCHHKASNLMQLAQKFVGEAPDRAPWLFYVWGHSYEFEQCNNWHTIEEFAEYISGKDDIWYATNIEIYDYIMAYKALIPSTDNHTIFNPTATKVFMEQNGKIYSIAPGETITLI